MLQSAKNTAPGILFSAAVAVVAMYLSSLVPGDILGATVMALLVGMILHPVAKKNAVFHKGINFTGKMVLRLGIIVMGVNMNIAEVLSVGKYSLFMMLFTMATAFGVGNLLGKLFGVNWKLTNLLSVSTAICGGSAVAAVGPAIKAKDEDMAYAISSTFIFDVITVVIFPWIGMAIGMTAMGYGLWIGTAVNDTSSVVAAGYAFSEFAGNTAVIVKLTRTLFIIPYVLIFSLINERVEAKSAGGGKREPVNMKKIFPFFILLFLGVVVLRSTGIIPEFMVPSLAKGSKFFMVMALAAIGLKTSFGDIKEIGIKPMILGFLMDTTVVVVAMAVLYFTGNF